MQKTAKHIFKVSSYAIMLESLLLKQRDLLFCEMLRTNLSKEKDRFNVQIYNFTNLILLLPQI